MVTGGSSRTYFFSSETDAYNFGFGVEETGLKVEIEDVPDDASLPFKATISDLSRANMTAVRALAERYKGRVLI